jgi:probable DNA repair protein
MLPPLIDIAPFVPALEADRLILTPNHRLAAKITQAWAHIGRSRNSVWPAPRVMSIDHWLKYCWDELQDQNHPLVEGRSIVGQQQSRYYWDRAIGEHNPEYGSKYSKLASDSLKTLQNWCISLDQVPTDNPGTEIFLQWAKSYTTLLQRNQLITTSGCWQLVVEGFAQGAINCEPEIALYGFQSLPPVQRQAITNACQAIIDINPASKNKHSFKLSCPDPDAELATAANWAAQQLTNNRNQRIGLVIPDLNNNLDKVARVVAESLAASNTEVSVNISAGTALLETGLIGAAADLFGLFDYQRPLQYWIQLLYSPYNLFSQLPVQFKVDSELALRDESRYEFTLGQFLNAVSGCVSQSNQADTIAETLQPLYELRETQRQEKKLRHNFSTWRQFFNQFLDHMGWPGNRSLDSIEYQQREHWQRLLEQYSSLDNLNIEVALITARQHLLQIAQDAVFHPQTGDAPLQILGLLEGAGLHFDQLWILGMHSQNLPALVSINPLLPADFQRDHQMPHSLPENEHKIAVDLLQGYRRNCQHMIVSYPQMMGEEQLAPSTLIRDFNITTTTDLISQSGDCPPWLLTPSQTELVLNIGPAYDPQIEKIRGGSTLLKNQSLCPFNAFAIHRLWAESLEEPSSGLSQMDRGTLLHDAMYQVWGLWRNSTHLHSLSDEQIAADLADCIDKTLTAMAPKHPILLGQRYRQLEQLRLQKLLGQWIEFEKQRPAFEVTAREYPGSIRFGDLQISVRLDRVDQSGDKQLVIDYKTGEVTPSHWLGERPKDPQLPLYILASETPANGCAFAQIKGGKIKFVGVADSEIINNQKPAENWPEQLEQWQQALRALANEFTTGHAIAEVFDSSGINYQKDLLPINRLPEEQDINGNLQGKS